jgi:signal transduction histidine kinase
VRRKNKELQKVNQDKDRIMGIVAHDLRNPISAVSSLTEIMMETTGEQTEQYEILKMIKTACNSSLELINEILLMAEMSGERSKVVKETVDVNEFLITGINLIRFRAQEKNQEIEPDLLILSTTMNVDPEKFRRVISNLITNAIKFSPEGSIIRVSAEKQTDRLLISVKDHGIGIPDAMKDSIFEPFTISKRLGTSGEKPFGLGLSIVKQIVEAHDGRIWCESEDGKGTTFFVELPI